MGKLQLKSQHRILCGDATSAEDVERLIDGHNAALCFTSPPYNAGPNSLGGNKSRVDSKYLHDDDNKPQDEYRQFLEQFTAIALGLAQTVAINLQSLAGNKVAVLEWIHHFRMHFVDRMVWYKGGGQPAMAANVMNSRFEDIWILSPEKNPKRCIPTGKFQSTVSNVFEGRGNSGENTEKAVHAATMPMHFEVHCLRSFDGTAGIVFEPFCGSGTTVIAAEKLKRRCFAMEIAPLIVISRSNDTKIFQEKRRCFTHAASSL